MRNDNDWVLLRLYLLIIHFMKKILFSPPDMSEAEINGVCDALNSGWITTGPRTKEFERKIATYCHTDKAVCLNSATACMESILRVLGVGAGDEVITSAYTYTATASVTCHVGAKVVMVDTAPDSFEMDYDKLAEAITPNTKVVIPVDLGGVMCDYDRIYEAVESKRHLFKSANEIQTCGCRSCFWCQMAWKDVWCGGRFYLFFLSCSKEFNNGGRGGFDLAYGFRCG